LLTDETGLVFVLIPGGTFWMGAQSKDPNGQNYDPQAEDIESDENGNPVEVTLAPYFLSKYEMTQGQWDRFTGENPSGYVPGSQYGDKATTLLHPVETVSWEDCVEMLGRLDLVLPTEAQWEHGCRAGTDTPWWPGQETLDLQGRANLADAYFEAHGGPASWQYEDDLNDGFVAHAPVGRFEANRFGLHDVHGNVWEWCLDGYGSYGNATRPGDGLREVPGASYRVYRGGSYYLLALVARSARRNYQRPGYRDFNVGLRPAKVISR
jgi:formylglycine-generating enzyme required for sulfatase activity